MSTQPTVVYTTPGTHGQVIPVPQGMTSTAQVIVIPAPSSPFEMDDTHSGYFVCLGYTQVAVGVLCIVFNIGAIVAGGFTVTMVLVPGIWVESLWVCMMTSWHDDCCLHCWIFNDDVITWKRFPRSWPFVRGIHRLTVDSHHRVHWRWALMLFFIWTNTWVNNRDAGDLRRHRTHYDVTMMWLGLCAVINTKCL